MVKAFTIKFLQLYLIHCCNIVNFWGAMTLGIMTFSLMTLSITTFSVIRKCDIHNDTEQNDSMLMQNVVKLNFFYAECHNWVY
jgi:hypothetical protein